MKLDRLKHGDLVIISLSGRLDVSGAGELKDFIADTDNNHKYTSLIVDMEQVSYVSSAGLRELVVLSRKITSSHGRFAICKLQPFCAEVMKITGLQNAFKIFDSVAQAEEFCGKAPLSNNIEDEKRTDKEKLETQSGKFLFNELSNDKCSLTVTGEQVDILHSRVNQQMVHGRKFKDLNYSMGVGALGNLPSEYLPAQGNMLTVGGAMYWFAPSSETFDYLIPDESCDGEVLIQTPYNVALKGEFNDIIKFTAKDMMGAEVDSVYSDLLRLAGMRRPDFKGIIWCSMITFAGAVFGRNMKKAPLHENRPDNDKVISHPTNEAEWFNTDVLAQQRDCVCMVSGCAVDLMRDLSDYSEVLLERVFYMNPAALGGKTSLTKSHVAVFRNVGFNPDAGDFEQECRRINKEAEFVRTCELMGKSKIKQAVIALSYIDALETPEQLDSMFARTLDYKLNRNNMLLRTYHLDRKTEQ